MGWTYNRAGVLLMPEEMTTAAFHVDAGTSLTERTTVSATFEVVGCEAVIDLGTH